MAGDPQDMVVLTSARSEVHAGLIVSILESHGIPAFSPSAAASTLRWEVGATDPYRVFVRRGDAGRAREVLSQERAGSVDIDWSQVDVGDEPPSPAPGDRSPAGPGARLLMLLAAAAVFLVVLVWAAMGWIGGR